MTARVWDQYDAYLFDIDGTLLNCTDAVHYFAFCDALSAIAGRPVNLDGVATHGNVDVAILRDAWGMAGISEEAWRPRLDDARKAMCAQVARNRDELHINVLPGVHEVLSHLKSQGAILAVATGNLAGIGEVKLEHCGLLPYFNFGGYSDQHESRAEVFRAAIEQARMLTSHDAAICVFGDTPADIEAARVNHVDVIAIATGIFDYDSLAALSPTRTLRTLTELSTSATAS